MAKKAYASEAGMVRPDQRNFSIKHIPRYECLYRFDYLNESIPPASSRLTKATGSEGWRIIGQLEGLSTRNGHIHLV